MYKYFSVLLLGLILPAGAIQPSAPQAISAPLRSLKLGSLNFLHTTDTHGWHAGHLLEASYSADWGDYIDFASRLREKIEADGNDLLVIDTGDRVEGNGLYDASDPKGKYTFDIFKQQHMDIICSGNHELYKKNSSENEYNILVPAYHDAYIASNIDIVDPDKNELVALAPRFKKFTTKNQGIRILAFGFLFNFDRNYNNTVVYTVQQTIQQPWFQRVIRDRAVDLFLVAGHVPARSEEFTAIFQAIRTVHPDTPIQFLGGHYHIRDYKKYDDNAYALASGRFMETIGFQSIDGIEEGGAKKRDPQESHNSTSPTWFRRYIDNNLYSLYNHTNTNESTFHSDRGRAVSKMIEAARHTLGLDEVFGTVPQTLWMSRAPFPANNSIYTWLNESVFPDVVIDESRKDKSRMIMTNTGAIRFDIFKGAFTRDSTFIVSPFTSGFQVIKDVPYDKASRVLPLLNAGGRVLTQELHDISVLDLLRQNPNFQKLTETRHLAPPEQQQQQQQQQQQRHTEQSETTAPLPLHQDQESRQIPLLTSSTPATHHLIPGYTTQDDLGSTGDDTIHLPIQFHQVPNVIQSFIPSSSSSSSVDLIYNEFLQPYILLALKFLGETHTEADCEAYIRPGLSMTDLIALWIRRNWN